MPRKREELRRALSARYAYPPEYPAPSFHDASLAVASGLRADGCELAAPPRRSLHLYIQHNELQAVIATLAANPRVAAPLSPFLIYYPPASLLWQPTPFPARRPRPVSTTLPLSYHRQVHQ